MKQLIINAILSLLMMNCKGQITYAKNTNNPKKDTMEYFNKDKYKDLPVNKNRLSSTTEPIKSYKMPYENKKNSEKT
ncbi:hypothetical protein HUE46_11450 [Flavobacterium columnare]|uniref:hypothetical protein n=1 Tax=Flavobacterium columnare TaxID=996 RepID=UPI00178203B0|nr:hypothetical protein [Flavobacterium columnare]QOG90564.1 hypothetical protein HUE41_11450 [Flavobacterium columnare]QOG93218.1 hypothetical protein HUE42_11445 [Flavobacterium columnare]QOG95885.1 hypothetical protein HUE43_11445 [Flavobacterium columnare]QOG98545.1 hypothetical protein HUE44_11445 [Flavobacterium columnare]QOH01204.1 hypothetical protein HUE45_11445 [Flavobacterium columnare]